MPVRASEKMSYGPAWGNLYMHEDEILRCAAEDQKHCFHTYRPGYEWTKWKLVPLDVIPRKGQKAPSAGPAEVAMRSFARPCCLQTLGCWARSRSILILSLCSLWFRRHALGAVLQALLKSLRPAVPQHESTLGEIVE